MHEMLHAIGFVHEQSRPDRDQNVRINFKNIIRGQEHNFQQYGPNQITTHGTPYDLNSIMHYGPKSFSKNGRNTVVALRGDSRYMGQRGGFSKIDKIEIGKHYGCGGGGQSKNGKSIKNENNGKGKNGNGKKGKGQNVKGK
jgi:hypothetical protein